MMCTERIVLSLVWWLVTVGVSYWTDVMKKIKQLIDR